MLRVVAHKSAAAAHRYYTQGLRREDYYTEGQEVVGMWHGKAAELLGLSGKVTPEAFAALVDNKHPVTGERITARNKAGRVVGYDLNFHAPKSLSILHALTNDEGILNAFRSAVIDTMGELESKTATRIRKSGAQENRETGNLVWAEFVHFTARPVAGIPDPHLHAHAFAMNCTFDAVEERWKAANFRGIKEDASYSEAVFHSKLTENLVAIGYRIERTRTGWEIEGIPRSLIDKFSCRTAQIEQLAKEKQITDPKAKDALGAESRASKPHSLKHSDLLAAWKDRLTPEDHALISKARFDRHAPAKKPRLTPAQALDEALEKLFAKNSVVPTKRLIAEALRFGVGRVRPDDIWRAFEQRKMIVRNIGGESFCSSVDVLAEEVSLINFVRTGRGMHAPFRARNIHFQDDRLAIEQKNAVRHILTSTDQVIAIRGGAGVGKTTLMSEAVAQIEATGMRVFAFAPSAAASRGTLREAGFANAETVAHLLINSELQEKVRGQVIWIDEAGLLGIRDMWEIMRIAGNGTRVILTGDTAQHAPVARGDAFRLLQQHAGLKVAEVTEIRRQESTAYRDVVASLSKGDLRTGFRRLDKMGAIFEIEDDAERYRLLAQDFLALSRKNSVPLVVSPTHAESAMVTTAIRDAKREAGQLGAERVFNQYHNLQWEEPDRRRSDNYHAGLVVQFHQYASGIRRGQIFRVTAINETGSVQAISDSGQVIALPLKDADRFQVFEGRQINLARGDRIRITRNGKSDDGRKLSNGNVFTVQSFSRDGKIVLNTGAVLAANHGHLAYGFCSTSYSSQSKSVRDVLVAQSANSFLASSREQFYVSCSRAKESIRIFTDDRQGLQEAVGNTSIRRAGIELAGFTSQEITSYMSTELGAAQWREMVQSRKTEGSAKIHVQNVLFERKQDGLAKPANMDFRKYVEMRRELNGADGKSRSKEQPSGDEKKKVNLQNRGRSFIRPTELTDPTKEKMVAANTNKKPVEGVQAKPVEAKPPRQTRLGKGYEAAKDHFKQVTERIKNRIEPLKQRIRSKQFPESNVEQLAKHRAKQRPADSAAVAKQQTKTQQKTAAPAVRKAK